MQSHDRSDDSLLRNQWVIKDIEATADKPLETQRGQDRKMDIDNSTGLPVNVRLLQKQASGTGSTTKEQMPSTGISTNKTITPQASLQPSVIVQLSEEGLRKSSGVEVIKKSSQEDIIAAFNEFQAKGFQMMEADKKGQRMMVDLHKAMESFIQENDGLDPLSFDFSLRSNGTLKIHSDTLSDKEMQKLELAINKRSDIKNLAIELTEISLITVGKSSSARHSHDGLDLTGIEVSEKTVYGAIRFNSLLSIARNSKPHIQDKTNLQGLYSLPSLAMAKALYSRLKSET